jgi:hypothetical protein
MPLSDLQFISIIITIVGAAVGPTAWITWRLSKALTKIEGLEGRLNRVEDDIRTVFGRIHEISVREAAELRQDLREERSKTSAQREEKKGD